MYLVHPEVVLHLGLNSHCHTLFYGPSNSGKSILVNTLTRESNLKFIEFSLISIVSFSETPGEPERMVH